MSDKKIKISCKNVYKNGNKVDIAEFNKKWIEVIELLEKVKKKF